MTVGYDPFLIRLLSTRTRAAIDSSRLKSTDPAAADAMRALRVLRSTLEDHWMPALDDIERSTAMTSWTRSALQHGWAGDAASPPHRFVWTPLTALTDSQLIDQVEQMNRRLIVDRANQLAKTTSPGRVDADELDTLAAELADRVRRDSTFAARLVAMAADCEVIGLAAARASFPSAFLGDVARSMMWPHGPTRTADLDHYADSLSAVLGAIAGNPSASLDLLLDSAALYGIVAWDRLDHDVVNDIIISGLHDAVVADPARLGDGYEVLRRLTVIANGPLDRGIHPGAALGVAASLSVYLHTLGPAIRQEGDYPVLVIDERSRLEIELGTYDDLVDLMGVLLRDAEAQAALGISLGGYATGVVTTLGAGVVTRPGVEHIARFTDLVADASRTEQAELVMQAAAEEAARRRVGAALGVGVSVALAASGVSTAARSVASRAITIAADFVARVEPSQLPPSSIPSQTYDLITVAALAVVTRNPDQRRLAGLATIAPATWTEVDRRLDEIDETTDPSERTRQTVRLHHWIEVEVPLLASFIGRVRSTPGMDELTESRTPTHPD